MSSLHLLADVLEGSWAWVPERPELGGGRWDTCVTRSERIPGDGG